MHLYCIFAAWCCAAKQPPFKKLDAFLVFHFSLTLLSLFILDFHSNRPSMSPNPLYYPQFEIEELQLLLKFQGVQSLPQGPCAELKAAIYGKTNVKLNFLSRPIKIKPFEVEVLKNAAGPQLATCPIFENKFFSTLMISFSNFGSSSIIDARRKGLETIKPRG